MPLFELQVDLAKRIEQMGGTLSKHLTDNVSYLIADGPGSDKYRVCLFFFVSAESC